MNALGALEQSDLEALSAWLDGELPAADADRVGGLVASDPAWGAAHRELAALDEALAAMPVPRPSRPLTERIVRAALRRRLAGRVVRIAAPLAAAAAVVIAVLALTTGNPPRPRGIERTIATHLADVAPADRALVANLGIFAPEVESFTDVRDVVDADTLAALASLEAGEDL